MIIEINKVILEWDFLFYCSLSIYQQQKYVIQYIKYTFILANIRCKCILETFKPFLAKHAFRNNLGGNNHKTRADTPMMMMKMKKKNKQTLQLIGVGGPLGGAEGVWRRRSYLLQETHDSFSRCVIVRGLLYKISKSALNRPKLIIQRRSHECSDKSLFPVCLSSLYLMLLLKREE